jgi:hypothetical protein
MKIKDMTVKQLETNILLWEKRLASAMAQRAV